MDKEREREKERQREREIDIYVYMFLISEEITKHICARDGVAFSILVISRPGQMQNPTRKRTRLQRPLSCLGWMDFLGSEPSLSYPPYLSLSLDIAGVPKSENGWLI